MKRMIIVVTLGFSGSTAIAATHVVAPDGSGDFPTIQAAMDASSAGDVIELTDGVFRGDGNRDVQFRSDVTLRSQSGDPSGCTIDCEGTPAENHIAFSFCCGSLNQLLEGITITGSYGSALVAQEAGVTVRRCILIGNTSTNGGAANINQISGVTFIDCLITGNHATQRGGGIWTDSGAQLIGTTIAGNSAGVEGGGLWGMLAIPTLERSILWGNCAGIRGHDAWFVDGGQPFECSLVDSSGVEGDEPATYDANTIFVDPLFCDPADCAFVATTAGDYRLDESSPAAAENSPCGQRIGALGVGCGASPVVETTWGRIKSRFVAPVPERSPRGADR